MIDSTNNTIDLNNEPHRAVITNTDSTTTESEEADNEDVEVEFSVELEIEIQDTVVCPNCNAANQMFVPIIQEIFDNDDCWRCGYPLEKEQ